MPLAFLNPRRAAERAAPALRWLAPVASTLPAFPGSVILAAGLNLAFGNALPPGLEPLRGKRIALRASDSGLCLQVAVMEGGFAAVRGAAPAAVTISASLADFLELARRRVDPDTLFFARRLLIEGDTELGLLLKNRLDALDFAAAFSRLPRPPEALKGLGTALRNIFPPKRAA